ncbi:MAG: YdcF family protein [Kiloniellaceae bacterium]
MLFVLSKVFWTVFNPGTLLVVFTVCGALALLAPWRRVRGAGRAVLALALLAMLAIAILPLGTWLLAPLEDRFPSPDRLPAQVDGIIVLGGALDLRRSAARNAAELNEHADRMTAFAALARRYPDARLVFAGGSGLLTDQEHRESDFALGLLAALGIGPQRLAFERESRNTHENALYSKEMVRPQAGEAWLLVTSAFHMPRAVGAFRRVGWDVTPYPVDFLTGGRAEADLGFEFTRSLALVTLGLHEWIGLIVYRVLGWSDRVFPAPEHRLDAFAGPARGRIKPG